MIRFSFVIGSAMLIAVALSIPASAQHGGGHAGSSAHGSSHGYASGGTHSHGASLSTTPSTLNARSPLPSQLVYPEPIGLQPQYSGYTGINYGALTTSGSRYQNGYGSGNQSHDYSNGYKNRRYSYGYGYKNGRYGYGYGYALPYYPYYLSTFDDSPYSTSGYYDNSASAYDSAAIQSSNVTADLLGDQIARLSAEVDALRNERQGPAYEGQAPVPYRAPPAAGDDDTAADNPVTLVLQNGKKIEMRNYAVMGNEIWDFSSAPTRKIPFSSINIAASRTATENNGAEFPNL